MTRRAVLATVVLALVWLPHADAEESIAVAVANQDIDEHTKLSETMVSFERIPRTWVQPGALTKVDQLLGQLSAVKIARGTQLTTALVVSLDGVGLAFKIPAGYRSFTFNVDPDGPLGDVRPGNYVDLLLVAAKGKGSVATTLLQNVYVLAVGSDTGALEVLGPGDVPHRRRRDDPPRSA